MNRDDMEILNEIADIIRKNGSIKKTELWKLTTISFWKFEKIKQYIPAAFDDIKYDRKHQKYISRNNISQFVDEDLK